MDLHFSFADMDEAKTQGELMAAKVLLAMLLSERQDQKALFERCVTLGDGLMAPSQTGKLMNRFAASYQESLGAIFALAKAESDRKAKS